MSVLKEYTIQIHQRGDAAAVHTHTVRAWDYHTTTTDNGIRYVFTANEMRVQTVQAELFVSGQDTVLITKRDI